MRSRSNLLVLLGIAFFIVGGVIVYLLTTDDDEGADAAEQVEVVVASTAVTPGQLADELIAENKLRTEKIDASQLVAGAIGSLNQLEGATFTQGFQSNQQITAAGVQLQPVRTFEIPEGHDAVAVQLEFVAGVAAYVSPGDFINLYGTLEGTRAELVLSNVEVLDVDRTIAPRRGTATDPDTDGTRASADNVTYLLALTPEDVERVVFLTEFQGIYATLVPEGAAPAGPTPGATSANVFE